MTTTETIIKFDTIPVDSLLVDTRLRDALAFALIAQQHREIKEDITNRFLGDTRTCGRSMAEGACGSCQDCVYLQHTYSDLIGDGLARWKARATELLGHVTKHIHIAPRRPVTP